MQILIAAMLAGAPALVPLEYRFEIRRAEGSLYNPWTLSDDKVRLRSFVGSGAKAGDFVAPVIRVAPGQRLAIDIDNRLEPCTEKQRADHACYNDTNMHTHGLWVSPSGNSDNVLISIKPEERFRYEYEIPADHPAGTFWYHPHAHGAGFVQVGSGMAGALIVTGNRLPTASRPGDIDILLKDERDRPLPERVMIIQQIEYGCFDEKGKIEGKWTEDKEPIRPLTCSPGNTGQIESFDTDWGWSRTGRYTGINGKVQPQLADARAGGFERWRLVNAGTGEGMRMRLYRLHPSAPPLRNVKAEEQVAWRQRYCVGDPLPMWQIALDGLTRSEIRKVDEAILFAGERLDVLARLPEPGLYCMVNDTSRVDTDKNNPSRMVALIEAKGVGAGSSNPETLLQAMLVLAAEKALAGEEKSAVRARVVSDLRDGLKLTSFTWHKAISKEEVSGYREAILNILDGPERTAFRFNGLTYDHNRIDAVLPLGKAEEWRAIALIDNHPLHIHVNPFQIVSIEDSRGSDVTDPNSPAFDPDYAGL